MALRELPCPYRIIDDFGGAFSMGCAAGCIIYFAKGSLFLLAQVFSFLLGMWFAPKRERLFGGMMLLKKRSPVLGGLTYLIFELLSFSLGSFALWGGLFSATDCLLIHLRNKEDYINPIIAGFFTGGLLAIRGFPKTLTTLDNFKLAGSRVALRNAIFGGIILGCIQLVEVGMIKWNMRKEMQMMQKRQEEEIEKQKDVLREMRPGS